MMENDKAYYLKNRELAVLLSIKGMNGLYGMKMEDIRGSADQSLVYGTLFGLEKKKIISVCQNHIAIHPEIDSMLECIKDAEKMLLNYGGNDKHCGQCIYLCSRAVLLSQHGERGGMKRLQSFPLNLLAEKICERGFYLEEMISDKSLFHDKEVEKPKLKEVADGMFVKETDKWEAPKEVQQCLRMILLKNGKCIRQYLLAREKLNDYFIVTDEKESHVYAYSKRKVMEILRQDLKK